MYASLGGDASRRGGHSPGRASSCRGDPSHHSADTPFVRFFHRKNAHHLPFGNGGNPVAKAEYLVKFKRHKKDSPPFVSFLDNTLMDIFNGSHIKAPGRL
jgi:hypothetical protein